MKENQEREAQGLPPVAFTPRMKMPNGDMYPHEGRLDYANNRVNPTTGTVTVTASFPNPNSLLLPGQFVRILIQRGQPELRLLLPQASVLEDMQGRYVFVVDDGDNVARKNVTLGQREGTRWVVETGLEEGDRVVVHGVQKVRPGMQVTASPVGEQP
jgi:membrane fusion protein (multidrug efflux system)